MIKYLTKIITKAVSKQQFANQRQHFDQTLDKLNHRINHLFVEYKKEPNLDNKYKIVQDIINVKQQMNKYYFIDKTDEYIGYRKDQLILAQIQLKKNNLEECKSIIQSIMQSDFENEMKEDQDKNQAFLAELYYFKCMSNLSNLLQAQEDAIKALNHYEYFVENKCAIYKAVIKDDVKPDENAQFDTELQHINNMVQHLLTVADFKQHNGQYQDALDYLFRRSSLLSNQGKIIKKMLAKEITLQQKIKDSDLSIYQLKSFLQSAITIKIIARVCIRLARYDDAKKMIQTALKYYDLINENRIIHSIDDDYFERFCGNYIDCLCDQYQIILDTTNNEEELNKIIHKLEKLVNDNHIYSKFLYAKFKVQYLNENPQKLTQIIMNDLKNDVPSVLEYNKTMLNYYIQNEQYDEAIKISNIQLEYSKKKFGCSHNLFATTLMHSIQISILTGKLEQAKQYLQVAKEAQNVFNLEIQYNIKLFDYRIDFDELKQQKDSVQQLEKLTSEIESLASVSFSFAFGKANLLEYIYGELYRLTTDSKFQELEKAKQNECQAILTQYPQLKSQLKTLYHTSKQF